MKQRVGAVESIQVVETGLVFKSRIDTGARTTSLHATNIRIENADPDKEKNVGKYISFCTFNELKEQKELRIKVTGITRVTNAQGIEYRYMVKLNLLWNDCQKQVEINLRDRSHMQYKLLIGRDWLHGDYLVDVEMGDEGK